MSLPEVESCVQCGLSVEPHDFCYCRVCRQALCRHCGREGCCGLAPVASREEDCQRDRRFAVLQTIPPLRYFPGESRPRHGAEGTDPDRTSRLRKFRDAGRTVLREQLGRKLDEELARTLPDRAAP